MSRMSNTAECENRELAYLTLSKGGRITRVTPTSTWLTALIQISQKFLSKKDFGSLLNKQAKVLPTLQENTVMLLHLLVI